MNTQSQQQQSQQSQTPMTDDRSRLSDKELHYLKDYMSWELLAMKKCADSANRAQDPAIAELIRQTGQKHLDHFNTLLSHLK